MTSWDTLHAAAQERHRPRADATRVVVQVGHCSQAVGAAPVAQTLEKALGNGRGAYLVRAGCDGACFNAPQILIQSPSGETRRFGRVTPAQARRLARELAGAQPPPAPEVDAFFAGQHRLALEGCGVVDPGDIHDYILRGGYRALAAALSLGPEEVIAQVERANLRGRGGAYFPTGRKWRSARSVARTPRHLVVNAEEGEPGIYKDRHLMEGDPHRLLEGMVIAGYAAGAEQAYLYINAEADLSAERMQLALEQAEALNLVGDRVLASDFSLHIEIRRGAGGYVCGEETTLMNTVQGDRRVPRLRPPFPTEAGLWGQPTVINNVETLVAVPFILTQGPDAFAAIGAEDTPGTKLFCLSGAVRRPGLVEAPLGISLRQVVYDIGGGPPEGRSLAAIAAGGPSSGVLPPDLLDTPLRPPTLHPSGVVLGAGGVVVVDDRMSIMEVVRSLAAYNAAESCGKCTPCREGAPRMVDALERLLSGGGSNADIEELRELSEVVAVASLCGLGQMAGNPITSALHLFGDRFAMLAGARGDDL